MKTKSKKQLNARRFLNPECLEQYLIPFTEELAQKGFTSLTIAGYFDGVAHFGTWLKKQGKQINDIDLNCTDDFAKHRCNCPGGRQTEILSKKYVKRVLKFVIYLDKKGVIDLGTAPYKSIPPLIALFSEYLHQRGLSPLTIKKYQASVSILIPKLGSSTEKYEPTLIQQVICDLTQPLSRGGAKSVTVALRSYLRFLSLEGLCPPDLDKAVPSIAQWKLSSMPRYIESNDVELVINACDINTHIGLRDRAIILLLARLGLRAGDIVNMRTNDINWSEGTLTVWGKGQKESRLPLPQDTGDAILVYLDKVRPRVALKALFLCINAPYRALGNSPCVSNIARAALLRSGVANLPFHGAHLLRHSAATSLLREGATLETVSALLRHSSLDMTVYYAKVDIPNLLKITQPWPEKISC
ncbi:MAG: tyrosine-type recombinase/integrase [Colwellia sp.]|jgi:Site-specific recombinase XerD